MILFAGGQRVEPGAAPIQPGGNVLCFALPAEAQQAMDTLGISTRLRAETLALEGTRYESRYDYDYITVRVPDFADLTAKPTRYEIYFTGKTALFIGEPKDGGSALIEQLEARKADFPSASRAIYLFFNQLFGKDADYLEDIDDEIADLEERVINKETADCTAEISNYRRRVLILKRYYQGLVDLHEDLEENQSGLFSKSDLKQFRLHTNRADRFYHTTLNLGEYITQVREAYQNQLDISLNETMKLFTVITTIFLPLTLIAGWYGMNLAMPEYSSPYAYPVVIALCLVIAVGLIIYFKKKKWF